MASAAHDVAGTDLASPPSPFPEVVVVLDARGRPVGTLPKARAHHADTPFHLAFSCHVVDASGRVLLTRRAAGKLTWPATWTNACCGHPAPGETLRQAVSRRLAQELGLTPVRMGLALPDFTYRAEQGGIVEHELCPVVVAEVGSHPVPDPDEVDDVAWVSWDAVVGRAGSRPESLSPWSVRQVRRLAELAPDLRTWLDTEVPPLAGVPGGLGGPDEAAAEGDLATGAPPAGEVGLDVPLSPDHAGLVAVETEPVGPAAEAPAPAGDLSADPRPVGAGAEGLTAVDADARADVPRVAAPPDAAGCGALDAVREAVDRVLDGFLDERQREADAVGMAVAAVGGEVRELIAAGGKRLRPAFTYWGHRATGAPHDDRVLHVAAAVELLHTFALVHDDVMDRSERRRGRATTHVAFTRRHERAGLLGDGGWFGVSAALLAGDMAFVWADQLLDAAALADDAMARARRVFTTLRTEVIGGQALDLHLSHVGDADEGAARRVALLKSARYTVTRPLQLGAVLAYRPPGADTADPAAVGRALARYGDAVGLAFQMRDDVLGLFGDPEVTGKSRLDDLREGKRTVLVLRALELAAPGDRAALAGMLGNPEVGEDDAGRARQVVARSGALASVEALITSQLAVARHAIASLAEPAHTALDQLADLAVRRDV